jgi:hypothetical protein
MKQDRKNPDFNPDLQVAADFTLGQGVELHPGTDRWMMGDRLGRIARVDEKGQRVRVKLDRSGKSLWFSPKNVMPER